MKEKNTKSKLYLVLLYTVAQYVLSFIKSNYQSLQNSCIVFAYTQHNFFSHVVKIYEYLHHVGR